MLPDLNFKKRMLQNCPLCNEPQPIFIAGTTKHPEEDDKMVIIKDRGFSFCNCKNVWFTDWKNIEQSVYDDEYVQRYEGLEKYLDKYVHNYFARISKVGFGNFLEIGCINDAILDAASRMGSKTFALDIVSRETKHEQIICDFNEMDTEELIKKEGKFNVIWASHVFEHFKDPLKALDQCTDLLNDGGYLFVAMPDPFFIDFNDVYKWGHWHVYEHHIMWDRDSFVDEVSKRGYECLLKFRNSGSTGFICTGDYHLIFRKAES